MNVWLGISSEVFNGRPTNLHRNEGLRSPHFEYHIIFEFSQFLHTLKSLRVHLLQINTHCKEIKINMNVWLDITSFRQIYIEMKACILPFQWEQINTTLWKEIKINMNVWLDITSEVPSREADKVISK